jgi:Rrf2 family protein
MQLTRAADYAVRVMIHLAGMPPGVWANLPQLAAAAGCPPQFLSKVLQRLGRAGLVVSHRGNTGGFELPESRRSTSLLEVVEAIEGPLRLNLCLGPRPACVRSCWCPAHSVWADAQTALEAVLKGATIDELARRAAANPAPRGDLIGGPKWN